MLLRWFISGFLRKFSRSSAYGNGFASAVMTFRKQDVRRRFGRSLWNLFHLYKGIVDSLMVFDNSGREPRLVVHAAHDRVKVWDLARWDQIQSQLERKQ